MKKETIQEMRARHQREIKELQKNCSHPEKSISDWINAGEQLYGVFHPGFEVKICGVCGAIADMRRQKSATL